jgi:signal transduction histidine kinase
MTTSPETRRTLVLNVDDYDPSRYARTQVLRHAGFDVVEVATGRDALDAVRRARPSIVLLDVNLPDMSGLEVCRALKADPRTTTVPVLHISATFTRPAHAVRALDGGADAYLVEPVDPPVLLATMNALLRARRAEEALTAALARERAMREELETAGRAKDQFLATLSHELRSPLAAILGWARMLRGGSLDAQATAHALQVIERNILQQTQLVEDMLDVSRIITGQLRLQVSPTDMVAVVRAALDAIGPTADAKGVHVELRVEGEVGTVLGDASRLQQVVSNLLSNAVKFTPAGGRIDVRLVADATTLRLTTTDTGQGIPAEFLPHLFERFRQADSGPARAQGGLGLGLAIVRHLVELHGGTISVESDGEARGSTFLVTLPRRPAPSREAHASTPTTVASPTNGDRALEGLRVLVVDDDLDTREVLTACLTLEGATVITADTTAAALELLHADRPAVIVSDIGMPGRDGYALIASLRALSPGHGGDVPAIALTGYARAQDEAEILRAGYDLHLAKPIDPDVLTAAIAKLVQRQA